MEAQAGAPVPGTSGSISSPSKLPVAQAVLFSSGVGYFQREGVVEGTTRVDLTFPVRDVNDLLKSMIVRDLDGGHIGTVSYDSNAPVEKTLNSFAINLTGNPSLAAILNQARGEKVEVQSVSYGTLTGCTVVGVETQKVAAGKETVDCEVLNVSAPDGLRSFKMSEVQRVRFLNPIMDSEFKKALETMAQSHDTQKKAVSINFAGEGKRNVRVGYVVENPVWKTSYRLVLPSTLAPSGGEGRVRGEKDVNPYLQGWAVVENVSDEDWKDVRVSLVSGRPISFQMDLYQPLFVPRPTVVPELFASMQPRVYSGNSWLVGGEQAVPVPTGGAAGYTITVPFQRPIRQPSLQINNQFGSGLQFIQTGSDQPTSSLSAPLQGFGSDINGLRNGTDVTPVAKAAKLGDFFQYVIQHPVTLARQKSAMLPIVGKDVEATRVSIYNEGTLAAHPLLGVKLKNTTGLHLMQGPITVFENGSYAGDAHILDLQPNEERLISYAVDLGTEVVATADQASERITFLKLNKGLLETTIKVRVAKTYRIKNRSEQERLIVVEHPIRPEYQLISKDKPSERTRDAYRFEIKLAAGKSAATDVVEERTVLQSLQMTSVFEDTMKFLIAGPARNTKLKPALQKALDLRNAQAKTQSDLNQIETQLRAITEDQTRLRANLKEMPPTAAAYKRYLDKFDKQEAEIEKLQDQVKTLGAKVVEQQQAFEEYLQGLNLESSVGESDVRQADCVDHAASAKPDGPPKEPACKVVATWLPEVVRKPDRKDGDPVPCLEGRVYLFDLNLKHTVRCDGTLTVFMYDPAKLDPKTNRPVLLEKWNFSEEVLNASC